MWKKEEKKGQKTRPKSDKVFTTKRRQTIKKTRATKNRHQKKRTKREQQR